LARVGPWLAGCGDLDPDRRAVLFDVLSKVSRQRTTGNREGTPTDEDHEPTDRDAPGGMDSVPAAPG
jgi:hypothetical protein